MTEDRHALGWAYSFDGERYELAGDGEVFDTAQLALATARKIDPEAVQIWVGKVGWPEGLDWFPDAADIIELVLNEAGGDSDTGGWLADERGWLAGLPSNAEPTLNDRLAKVFREWLAEFDLAPDWFYVTDAQRHIVQRASEQGEGGPPAYAKASAGKS